MLSSPHQINWLRVDEDVPPHAVVTGSDLYIENLNKSYNGTYRCVASNTVGEAYDDYILYVYGRYRASLHLMYLMPGYHSLSRRTPFAVVLGKCKYFLRAYASKWIQKVDAVGSLKALIFWFIVQDASQNCHVRD